jgi:hypothetical protein
MGGYSGTPLAKKLGIKPGYKLRVVNARQNYAALLRPAANVHFDFRRRNCDGAV